MKRFFRFEYYLACAVSAAAFFVYLPSLRNKFVNWDDDAFLLSNPHIRSINMDFFKWAFTNLNFSNWYPLTWVSHALVYAVCALNPIGYHLVNTILHSINSFLAVVLAVRLIEAYENSERQSFILNGRGKYITGMVAGLLFALHPLHVESVAWAVERKDVLYGLFFLLGMLAWLKYACRVKGAADGRCGSAGRRYLLTLVLFACSLMSKPMAVSFPLVLLVMDWFPLGRIKSLRSSGAVFLEKLPFFALSGGVSALTLMAKNGKIMSLKSSPLTTRALVAAKSLVLYLWKLTFPHDLVPVYPYPAKVSFLDEGYCLSVLLVLAISIFCLKKARSQKVWLACWGYFVMTLLPVIGLIQVNDHWMADRYAYLPSFGPFMIGGLAIAWIYGRAAALKRWNRAARIVSTAALVFVFLFMSYLTSRQTRIWRNSLVFWNYVIEKEPGKVEAAYNGRGVIFEGMGQYDRALADLTKARAIAPSDSGVYYNLGNVYFASGQLDLAVSNYDTAIRMNPACEKAYNNRGAAFEQMGENEKALADFYKAVSLNPASFVAYFNLGNAYSKSGQLKLAVKDYNRAIALNPSYSEGYDGRGNKLMAGISDHADQSFRSKANTCFGRKANTDFGQKANIFLESPK